jgi:NAD(P)-dependent dehydrogenase (short-subunit alcohol dehydrogenase family)
MFDLTGRVALVTGGGRNAGAGIARALALQGAAVAVNDLLAGRAEETSKEINGKGGIAAAFPFDVTDLDAVRAAAGQVRAEFGKPVDILVHNAGLISPMPYGQFRDLDPAKWRSLTEVNLFGAMNLVSATVEGMVTAGWGRIVQISSGSARVGSDTGLTLYGSAKSGVEGFIRHLSQELGPLGITANTLALGLQSSAAGPGTAEVASRIAVGRLGTPEDVGAAVVYLASAEASWMTGQTINLNGGSVTT